MSLQGEATRAEILTAINMYIERYRFSPTVREISDMVGLKSTSTVHRHMEILKEKGKIEWNSAMPRTIRILEGA